MGVKHTALPDGQPPTVAFTGLAQLCGPKTEETAMGAALFTKNCKGRIFGFDFEIRYLSVTPGVGCHEARGRSMTPLDNPIFSVSLKSILEGWV